jgi:NADPH-dependent curcumin reductase CurA
MSSFGGDFRSSVEVVEEPVPEPGPTEVVVRNRLAGVNGGHDLLMSRDALVGFEIELPADTGVEAAGEVVALGEGVSGLAVGDPVITVVDGGGFREHLRLEAANVIRVDRADAEHVALARSGVIASIALHECGRVREGETVLITAAAGAVGHVAVQLARAAGARVVGTCGTPKKAALLRELGCDRVINYRDETLSDVLEDEYRDKLDLVLDGVGGSFFDTCLGQLALRGRLVTLGFFSEYASDPEPVKQRRVYHRLLWKSASVMGCLVPIHHAGEMAEHRERLFGLHAAGKLRAVVDSASFEGLDSVADAVEHSVKGKACGKVVVRL